MIDYISNLAFACKKLRNMTMIIDLDAQLGELKENLGKNYLQRRNTYSTTYYDIQFIQIAPRKK